MNSKQPVNYWIIWKAVSYLEIAEAVEGALNIDPNDVASVKSATELHIRPYVAKWPDEKREMLRLSFDYFLYKGGILSDSVLGNLPDLDMIEPDDVDSLFLWIREVLFPDDPREDCTKRCVEVNVVEDVNF